MNAIQSLIGSYHCVIKRAKLIWLSVVYKRNGRNSNEDAHGIDDVGQMLPTIGPLEVSCYDALAGPEAGSTKLRTHAARGG